MAIEILKESDPKKAEAWDRIHDKRKLYLCERCGSEWRCEYGENKFRTRYGFNEDPDILCQCCDHPTVKEVTLREIPEIMDDNKNCTTCIHCHQLFDPPICRINGESLPNPTGRFCNKYDTDSEVKYFCCGVDAYMLSDVYTTKGSLWFEDKKAGELTTINNSVTQHNVIRLLFELETEFNWLWDRKLGEFNFKIEFNEESHEIQLRLWRKE